jgi:HK97 family phage major capsid protein
VSNTIKLSPGQRHALTARGLRPGDVGRALNRTAQIDPDTVTIPDTSEGLTELLHDSAKMQAIFGTPKFGDFITAYARDVHKKDLSIATQVQEQVQMIMADWLRENQPEGVERLDMTKVTAAVRGPAGDARNVLHNSRAMGATLDRDFQGPTAAADYFATIWHQTHKTADVQAKLQRIRNAFSSTVPSEGGFLIPESLRSELLRVSLETSIVRPRARVIPMESLRVPFPAIDSTSNVSSVYGGVVGYWTQEGAALTASQASFGRIVLDAKKLTAYTEVPNELISDSIISFQAFLDQIFPEALGFYEDDAFINGTGVGEPLGYLNGTAAVSVSKESGQPADTIVWENLIKMYARMLPGSLSRAVWVVPPDAFPELATMSLSVGTGGSAIWLNNGASGPPATILGRPVLISEKVPKLGDAKDVSFVDFGFYLLGDRQVMSAMSSPHYKFGEDETAYRIIERCDGRPWLSSAITPKNNGATLSPIVTLAERA